MSGEEDTSSRPVDTFSEDSDHAEQDGRAGYPASHRGLSALLRPHDSGGARAGGGGGAGPDLQIRSRPPAAAGGEPDADGRGGGHPLAAGDVPAPGLLGAPPAGP